MNQQKISLILRASLNESNVNIDDLYQYANSIAEIIIFSDKNRNKTRLRIHDNLNKKYNFIALKSIPSFNKVLSTATGDYLVIIGDGVCLKELDLSLHLDLLKKNTKCGLIGFSKNIEKGSNIITPVSLKYKTEKVRLLLDEFVMPDILLFRTSFITKYITRFNQNNTSVFSFKEIFFIGLNLFQVFNIANTRENTHSNIATRFVRKYLFKGINDDFRDHLFTLLNMRPNRNNKNLYYKYLDGYYLNNTEIKSLDLFLNSLLQRNRNLKVFNQVELLTALKKRITKAIRANRLSGWSLDESVILFIRNIHPKINKILEFGSGNGTDALLEFSSVVSIEHDKNYIVSHSKSHTCLLAKIINNWYDRSVVKDTLANSFDLIIIDGPPNQYRKGILENIDLFNYIKTPFIFDDVNRDYDREIMIDFCRSLDFRFKIFNGTTKAFAFCIPND